MKRYLMMLTVLGIVVLLSGCSNIQLRGTVPNYEEKTYTPSEDIDHIILEEDDVPIKICKSDNEQVYVSYYNADDGSETYEIEEKEGTMIVSKDAAPNYGFFILGDQYMSDSYKKVKLTLFIPDKFKGKVSVNASDSDIEVKDVIIDNLEINAQNGDVILEKTRIDQKLLCKTKYGNVKATLSGDKTKYHTVIQTSESKSVVNADIESDKSIEIITKDGNVQIEFENG